MSAKTLCSLALVMTLAWCGAAGAQPPERSPAGINEPDNQDPGAVPPAGGDEHPVYTPEPPGQLSCYVTYQRPDCCGPVGGNGPIFEELFVRSGASLPVGGSIFGHVLETGWMIEAGGRTLCYNPEKDAAWSFELSLSNISNHGQHSDFRIPISIFVPNAISNTLPPTRVNFGTDPGVPGVSVRSLNRTFLDFGPGREWYFVGCATGPGKKWRAGIDVGGRYGSGKVEFNEIRHRPGVLEGAYASVHTDLECPCCSVTWIAGFRAEWDYTWSNILQDTNNGDVMDVNFMINLGVRF